jgi:hypothetical protein
MTSDHLDRGGVQLADAEAGGREGGDVAAGAVGPLLPHTFSMDGAGR